MSACTAVAYANSHLLTATCLGIGLFFLFALPLKRFSLLLCFGTL